MSIKLATDKWCAIARAGRPEDCLEKYRGRTQQLPQLRSNATFGGRTIAIDEPEEFGGRGEFPNPAEFLLASLGASLEVTTRVYAERLGIAIEAVAVDVAGNLDIRGFFATDPGVRSGFTEITAEVTVRGNASDDELETLFTWVERCCPVLDTLRGSTRLSVKRTA